MSSGAIAAERGSSARARTVELAERALGRWWVSYGLIVALQMRVIWNIWKYADLTNGDTSFYYIDAVTWQHGLREDVVYYPLYDAFWGTILAIVHDVYAATIIQRVAIVLIVTLLVLAAMRALLGPALALLIAAWWAILPANYHVLYEVHLLGAAPILLATLVVARAPRRAGLGVAVAILLASAVLVRTELVAAAALLAVAIALYEARERRAGRSAARSTYLRAYLAPLAIALLVIGGAYARSYVQGEDAWRLLQAKEQANFCNDYAASYQQRHPTRFTGNPFTECEPLMKHDFGRASPTILQAFATNPGAVAGFGAWNAQLLPSGLQVSTLGATEFENNPGFRPVEEGASYPLELSLALALAVLAALALAARAGELSPRAMTARTRWTLVTLASIAAATVLVVLTTRPWAEYMYGLGFCVLALVGVSASILLRRSGMTRALAPIALALVVVLIVVLPSFYSPGPRPIYEGVQHLQVVKARLQRPGSVLVANENDEELCNYLAYSYPRFCKALFWPELRSRVGGSTSVGALLDRLHATVVYADAAMLGDPLIQRLVAAPEAQGWRQIAQGSGLSGPWRVLVPLASSS